MCSNEMIFLCNYHGTLHDRKVPNLGYPSLLKTNNVYRNFYFVCGKSITYNLRYIIVVAAKIFRTNIDGGGPNLYIDRGKKKQISAHYTFRVQMYVRETAPRLRRRKRRRGNASRLQPENHCANSDFSFSFFFCTNNT